MADRVAVFNEGRIMQVGTPEEIYERPRTRFVADFVGSSNVLPPDFVAALFRPAALGEPAAGDDRASAAPQQATGVPARVVARKLPRRHHPARRSMPTGRGSMRSCRPARPCPATAIAVVLTFNRDEPAPDGGRGMTASPAADRGTRRSCRPRRACGRLSDLFWRRPRLLLSLMLLPPAAVARHRLSRLAVRAAAAELLLDRRVLRPDRPRVHAEDLWRAAAAGQSRHHRAHRRRWPALVTLASARHRLPDRLLSRRAMRAANGRRCSISASCCRSGRATWSRSMPGS